MVYTLIEGGFAGSKSQTKVVQCNFVQGCLNTHGKLKKKATRHPLTFYNNSLLVIPANQRLPRNSKNGRVKSSPVQVLHEILPGIPCQ